MAIVSGAARWGRGLASDLRGRVCILKCASLQVCVQTAPQQMSIAVVSGAQGHIALGSTHKEARVRERGRRQSCCMHDASQCAKPAVHSMERAVELLVAPIIVATQECKQMQTVAESGIRTWQFPSVVETFVRSTRGSPAFCTICNNRKVTTFISMY
jgi:hypothetical protein